MMYFMREMFSLVSGMKPEAHRNHSYLTMPGGLDQHIEQENQN